DRTEFRRADGVARKSRTVARRRNAARNAVARRFAEDDAGRAAARALTAMDAAAGSAPPQPLAGLRVVEFTHMVMGPTCGMMLAYMRAEVIKLELHHRVRDR